MIKKYSVIFLTDTIGEIFSFQKLNEGFQNIIYKIESGKGLYCLRVSKRNSPKHVQYEIDIVQSLQTLPTIRLQKIHNQYIFSLEGKTAILYSYIDWEIAEDNTLEELVEVGGFLADFHNLCGHITCPEDRIQLYDLPEWKISEYQKIILEGQIPYTEMLPEITRELRENRLSDNLPSGPIHADLWPRNILWHGGKIVAVLDFDNAYHGPYILDIGKSIMFFSSHEWNFDFSKAQAFLSWYVAKRTLLENEKRELYRAIKYAFLSHIFVDYYMYATRVTTSKYFDYIISDLYPSYGSFITQRDYNDFLLK